MKRKKVYQRIDTERDYQDFKWAEGLRDSGIPDSKKSIAEWLVYIEHLLNQAKEEVYYLEKKEALAHVRKLVATGVACLEYNGCPKRD